MTARRRLVQLHRYVGLVMAGFLIIAGLTGALLVWYYELDALINPQWLQVEPPAAHSELLSPFALRDQVDAAYPDANVHWMMLAPPDTHSPVRFFLSAKPGAPALPIDEVFVN
ncbi:PepSY domain-containing protein, partial [bacterium]|nr:PepSY domain-containing protein [bacterium]